VKGEVVRYGEYFDLYKRVRPGITGMWQISGRSNTSYEERISFDEYYVKNWSVWLDLYILFRTIKTVFLLEGAC
jgi:lipopolysaccharide/colanic/teichoic acid biosynthesis glycosyltransferase